MMLKRCFCQSTQRMTPHDGDNNDDDDLWWCKVNIARVLQPLDTRWALNYRWIYLRKRHLSCSNDFNSHQHSRISADVDYCAAVFALGMVWRYFSNMTVDVLIHRKLIIKLMVIIWDDLFVDYITCEHTICLALQTEWHCIVATP